MGAGEIMAKLKQIRDIEFGMIEYENMKRKQKQQKKKLNKEEFMRKMVDHHEHNLAEYAHDFDCTIEEAEKALRKGEEE